FHGQNRQAISLKAFVTGFLEFYSSPIRFRCQSYLAPLGRASSGYHHLWFKKGPRICQGPGDVLRWSRRYDRLVQVLATHQE
ncbi:MAG: hypothetical protein ACKVGW_13045, partial [Verrucomicrobiia bacterium]